ncbi:MAG: hypothetical protein HYX42_13395 [Polaromonas sp.]|uniref:hypothetical protein n=1 Tax=Polaromonas sp. TaxID=1869339 RepID=UPI0025F1A4B8|nr:hypothetical protein [Polaromonas sp.]MBI2727232.1 hypothetical protein [Polaromonas sp.]
MRRPFVAVPVAAVAFCLSACGEKPQTLGAGKSDVAAFQGADNGFVAPGWKAGDKVSWEQGLKARMQNTQNEYSRLVPSK